jgi:hypothetical protein
MPRHVIDVDAFMVMYPGLSPQDVMDMDEDCFDWLPVVRAARMKAAEYRENAGVPYRGRRAVGA